MAAKVRHLLDRGGRYWARVSVPAALRSKLGKRELLVPLGPDRREALRRLPGAVAEMVATIDAARGRVTAPPPPRSRPLFPVQVARAHYAQELALDTARRDAGVLYPEDDPEAHARLFRSGYRKALAKVAAGHDSQDEAAATIGWSIDSFIERGNIAVTPGSPQWQHLARTLAGIQLEVLSRQDERDMGNDAGEPKHHTLINKPAPKSNDPIDARRISPESELPISEIKDRYLKERGSAITMGHEFEVAVRMFIDHMGEDRPLYRIQRTDVREFVRALQETPIHSTTKFPGKSIREAITANKARATPFPTLSWRTIHNKYLSRIGALLAWCVRNEILPDSPAAAVRLEPVKARAAPRISFSPDDLTRIFGKHLKRPFGEFEWAMLISLFAGTRASETAQIKLDSIRHERSILILRVEEETKNIGSQRLVPVHRSLLDLGLEERVKQLRSEGQTHLFPQWYRQGLESRQRAVTRSLNLHWPKYIPKSFNRSYLPRVGIVDSRKSWHSFRHTFRTGLELAGVEKSIADKVTGHADGTMAATYTHATSVEKLKEAIDRLQFDGFTL